MEKLYEVVHVYIHVRGSADEEITKIVNDTLVKNGLEPCTIMNLGNMFSYVILQEEPVDVFELIFISKENTTISEEVQEKVNSQVSNKVTKLSSIKKIQMAYKNWMEEHDKALELLSLLIKEVLQKYK